MPEPAHGRGVAGACGARQPRPNRALDSVGTQASGSPQPGIGAAAGKTATAPTFCDVLGGARVLGISAARSQAPLCLASGLGSSGLRHAVNACRRGCPRTRSWQAPALAPVRARRAAWVWSGSCAGAPGRAVGCVERQGGGRAGGMPVLAGQVAGRRRPTSFQGSVYAAATPCASAVSLASAGRQPLLGRRRGRRDVKAPSWIGACANRGSEVASGPGPTTHASQPKRAASTKERLRIAIVASNPYFFGRASPLGPGREQVSADLAGAPPAARAAASSIDASELDWPLRSCIRQRHGSRARHLQRHRSPCSAGARCSSPDRGSAWERRPRAPSRSPAACPGACWCDSMPPSRGRRSRPARRPPRSAAAAPPGADPSAAL